MSKELLDSAKSLVTKFQLKSVQSSEILLKNMLILRRLKETYAVIQHINFSSCTRSEWASAENAGLGQSTFLLVNIISNVTATYLVFAWHTVFDYIFQMVACFNAVEQCSAINNLSIASALQLSKSGLCKLKTLCYIRRRAKSSLVLSECFCCQLCLLSSQLPSLHYTRGVQPVVRGKVLSGPRVFFPKWPILST